MSNPSAESPAPAPGSSVAIAIPAYQARPSIADIVERSLALLPDVLVIDDGSDDETGRRAADAGAEVITFPVNRGKGCALRTAFRTLFQRGFDAVVTVDADGQHLPEQIPVLLGEFYQGADLVLGTRDHLFDQMFWVRRLSNRLSSSAISFAAGRPFSDIQTGFRLYSRSLFETIAFPESRFEAESAVVVRASRRGLAIRTIPVEMGNPDGRLTSHYRPLIDSLRIASAVTRARFDH